MLARAHSLPGHRSKKFWDEMGLNSFLRGQKAKSRTPPMPPPPPPPPTKINRDFMKSSFMGASLAARI